jgi:hypothetical protein
MLQLHVSSVKKSKDEETAGAVPDVVQTANLNMFAVPHILLCPDLMIACLTQTSVNQSLPN